MGWPCSTRRRPAHHHPASHAPPSRFRATVLVRYAGPRRPCRKRPKASDDSRLTGNFQRSVPLWKHIAQDHQPTASLLAKPTPRNVNLGSVRFSMFNKGRDIPLVSSPIISACEAVRLLFDALDRGRLDLGWPCRQLAIRTLGRGSRWPPKRADTGGSLPLFRIFGNVGSWTAPQTAAGQTS
jgi:hypothetical protein